mgnify:CR=1 FL=1
MILNTPEKKFHKIDTSKCDLTKYKGLTTKIGGSKIKIKINQSKLTDTLSKKILLVQILFI